MKRENNGLLRKTLMVAVGIFLALPMMAFAQQGGSNWNPIDQRRHNRDQRDDDRQDRRGRNWDKYGTYGGSFQLRQTALNAGYNEGIKEGRKDQDRGRRNFRNNS